MQASNLKNVRILATLGPSSSQETQIEALFLAGADAFRINMSHTAHAMLNDLVSKIRSVEKKHGRPIGILADLQGPKYRLGEFAHTVIEIKIGDQIRLDGNTKPGDNSRVHLPHPEILEAIEVGHHMLVDDGRVHLKVNEATSDYCVCEVLAGTKLSSRKGISLPDTELTVSPLTPKDRADLGAVLENGGVDWVALSFVQRASDIEELRGLAGDKLSIMAKIEKPQALDVIDQIIKRADGIMVARGDLGVEVPLQNVPGIQRRLVASTRKAGKPCIVATQMLESMISAPMPTRAEVSDVASAVCEGADGVMLSAESAAGDYPVEAVTTMSTIIQQTESEPHYPAAINNQRPEAENTGEDAISLAAWQIVQTYDPAAIICYSVSGATALRISRERPCKPILAISPSAQTARKLTLSFGVQCTVTSEATAAEEMVESACAIAKEKGFAKSGEKIVITAGLPLQTPGTTNMVRVAIID